MTSDTQKIRARPAASMLPLDESMAQVREFEDREALFEYVKQAYDFWSPTEETIAVEFYAFDPRINWNTYLLTVDGNAALFLDRAV